MQDGEGLEAADPHGVSAVSCLFLLLMLLPLIQYFLLPFFFLLLLLLLHILILHQPLFLDCFGCSDRTCILL